MEDLRQSLDISMSKETIALVRDDADEARTQKAKLAGKYM